jgi:hypothetical protein
VVCPPAIPCVNGSCGPGGTGIDCYVDGGGCPAGTECLTSDSSTAGCRQTSCAGVLDDQACVAPYIGYGFCCSGECLSSYVSDPNNCGACGQHCDDGTVCFYGTCTLSSACTSNDNGAQCTLPSGFGGQCCEGSCTDFNSDPLNCGTCGWTCLSGASCTGGGCSNPCDGGVCPAGTTCIGGSCAPSDCGPASDGVYCGYPGGSICCGGECVDTSADSLNCGGCGNACPQGQSCLLYQCGSVAPCGVNGDACAADGGGLGVCCAGECVDLFAPTNRDYCAACGAGCVIGGTCSTIYYGGGGPQCSSLCAQDADCPEGRVCASGFCATASCDAGTSSCALPIDGGLVLGTCCGADCVDTTRDSANCLGCGNTCAPGLTCQNRYGYGYGCLDETGTIGCGPQFPCPPGSLCSYYGGFCLPPSCGPGMEGQSCAYGPAAFFVGTCCGGSCVDIFADPQNCDRCGLSVSPGTCVSVSSSAVPQNCLQSCSPGTICANATCVDSLCQPVQSYCLARDGTVGTCCSSGACANFDDDPFNCGACGISCPPGATCQNALCNGLAACGPGHAGSYCNLDAGLSFLCCPGLGCTDTSSDVQNCGACNAACASGQACDAGTCVTGG